MFKVHKLNNKIIEHEDTENTNRDMEEQYELGDTDYDTEEDEEEGQEDQEDQEETGYTNHKGGSKKVIKVVILTLLGICILYTAISMIMKKYPQLQTVKPTKKVEQMLEANEKKPDTSHVNVGYDNKLSKESTEKAKPVLDTLGKMSIVTDKHSINAYDYSITKANEKDLNVLTVKMTIDNKQYTGHGILNSKLDNVNEALLYALSIGIYRAQGKTYERPLYQCSLKDEEYTATLTNEEAKKVELTLKAKYSQKENKMNIKIGD